MAVSTGPVDAHVMAVGAGSAYTNVVGVSTRPIGRSRGAVLQICCREVRTATADVIVLRSWGGVLVVSLHISPCSVTVLALRIRPSGV